MISGVKFRKLVSGKLYSINETGYNGHKNPAVSIGQARTRRKRTALAEKALDCSESF